MIEAFATSQDLSITVNFTSDDPTVPFECRINDEEFISCKYIQWSFLKLLVYLLSCNTGTSPHTFSNDQVRLGNNQVVVQATCPGHSTGVTEVIQISVCVCVYVRAYIFVCVRM